MPARTMRHDKHIDRLYQDILNPRHRGSDAQVNIRYMLERKLLEISMNRFQWEGLPDSVNVRWLELALNVQALSVFHQTDTPEFGTHYEALRGAPGAGLNRTGDPTSFYIYGMDGSQELVAAADCVPIWANYVRAPDLDIIMIYASRIASMDRTIEINAMNARHPRVLKVNQNTDLSITNLRRQLESGSPALKVDTSSIDPTDAIEVLDLEGDPQALFNLHIVRTREWSECMTMLGINNSNQDKKERLTAAETAGNDDVIATIRETNLKARRIACDQINERFDLNVSVDYTTDMKTAVTKDVQANDDAALPEKVGA